jgi:signal transduction histidine kinase
MALRLPRVGGLGWLAGLVALLLPLLAWLQVDWVSQVASADRERRTRTLETAASQFTGEVDAELGRLAGSLQADGTMVEREDWEAYALRYEDWADNAAHPTLVRDVWLVRLPTDAAAAGDPAALQALQWTRAARAFAPAAWSDVLERNRQAFADHAGRFAQVRGRRERMASLAPLGDDQLMVMPVLRVTLPGVLHLPPGDEPGAPEMRLLGFVAIELDLDVLRDEVLPAIVQRHFPAEREYRVAVVSAEEPSRVIYESEKHAGALTAVNPDLALRFPSRRPGPFMFVRRDGRGQGRGDRGTDRGSRAELETFTLPREAPAPGAPPRDTMIGIIESRRDGDGRVETRVITQGEGRWLLRVQHRAGSLEAAVAAARRRNLLLSGSILSLLGVAVFLIAASARRAQRLARQQLEFVAAVSHELRTPVAVINTAAGNLADGVVADPSRVRTYGTTIQAEARRLGETVERVLQLAGLASGSSLARAPLAPADLVHEAVEACAFDVARAGAAVSLDLPTDLPMVAGDGPALRAALQNLVANAVKYGGPAPQVRIRARADRAAGRDDVLVVVEDDGLGIVAEDRKHIFEPFYRGRDAVARQIQGSGLGLSLVRRIAEAHGGTVSVKSEHGRGSVFTLRLPAIAGSAADVPVAGGAHSAAAHS